MMNTQALPIRRASHTLKGGRSFNSSSVNSFCRRSATRRSSVTSWATQGYTFGRQGGKDGDRPVGADVVGHEDQRLPGAQQARKAWPQPRRRSFRMSLLE